MSSGKRIAQERPVLLLQKKSSGNYKELITIGVAKSPEDIDSLMSEAREWIEWEQKRRWPRLDLFGEVRAAYHNLWHVERAFRISKSKIEIRPMFHFTRRRIEAHVYICFVALKV